MSVTLFNKNYINDKTLQTLQYTYRLTAYMQYYCCYIPMYVCMDKN